MQRSEYLGRGYLPRPPSLTAADIDRTVAANATCEACGRSGLAYEAYTRREPPTYIAVARCPSCGWGDEF